jgi:nucleoside-diphosphate-sugar epimerase
VLRCPGIYGPDRGVHVRLLRGDYRLPGDGSRSLSRIHVEDLAALLLATADGEGGAFTGRTFVVGDLRPAPHREVVEYLCAAYGVPWPASVPLESVHATLRADREVDGSRALSELGVRLRFPTYREGMSPEATGLARRG